MNVFENMLQMLLRNATNVRMGHKKLGKGGFSKNGIFSSIVQITESGKKKSGMKIHLLEVGKQTRCRWANLGVGIVPQAGKKIRQPGGNTAGWTN